MRLRRSSPEKLQARIDALPPVADDERDRLLLAIYRAWEHGSAVYPGLLERCNAGAGADELGDEALAAAREIARSISSFMRAATQTKRNLVKTIPEELEPWGIIRPCERILYALTALADDDCLPQMLVSSAEFAALDEQYQFSPWLAAMRDRYPDGLEGEAAPEAPR